MKRTSAVLAALTALLVFSTVAYGEDPAPANTETDPIIQYETENGKLEFVDYAINDDVIAIVVDYVNTTDTDTSRQSQIGIRLFQDGTEMKSGQQFDMKRVYNSSIEIHPGTRIRTAEFFKLESQHPLEIEFYPLHAADSEKAGSEEADSEEAGSIHTDTENMICVKIDLETNDITSQDGREIGTGGKIYGGIFGKSYEEYLTETGKNEKTEAEKALEEYAKAAAEQQKHLYDALEDYQKDLNDYLQELTP